MTTAFRATSSFGDGFATSASDYTITIPAAAQAGDIAVLTFQANSASQTLATPTGWTLASGPDATSTAATCWCFYKQLGASDPGATVTLDLSGTAKAMAQMDVVSGGTLTGALIGKTIDSASTTTSTIPTLANVPAGAYISVHFPRRVTGTAPTVTIPAGYIDDGDRVGTAFGSGQNLSSITAHKIASTTGTYGGETVTMTDSVGTIYAAAIPVSTTTYVNTAEGGTNGTTVTTGNSGGASGDAFGGTTVDGTGTTLTFSNAVAHRGSLSYKLLVPTSGHNYVRFNDFASPAKSARMRYYINLGNIPSSTFQHLQTVDSNSTLCYLHLDSAGKLMVIDAAGTTVKQFTNAMALNTWYRVEFVVTPGTTTTNGGLRAALYLGDSTTPIESYVNAACNAGTGNITRLNIGKVSSAGAWTGYIDDIASDNVVSTSFIGPSAVVAPPDLSGYVKVWDGGAWVAHPVKRWDGAAWVTHPVKVWDGAAWMLAKGSDNTTPTPTLNEDFTSLDLASSSNPSGFWRANDTWQNVDQGYADFGAGGSTWNLNPNETIGGAKQTPFSVSGGILTITAQRTPSAWASDIAAKNGGTTPPWCGGILISNTTQDGARFGYGYYEIKASIPTPARGIFPAIWLFAANGLNPGKEKAELDIMEVFGHAAGRPWTTTAHEKKQDGTAAVGATAAQVDIATTDTDTSGWHTYGLDWQETYLRFYQDDVLIGELTGADATFFQGVSMSIRLNFAMDATWFAAGDKSDGTTPDTVTMQVDYVRRWDVKP